MQPFTWVAAGRERGLGLYPVAPCQLRDPPAALAFVMGFARLTAAAIAEGVRELADLLATGPVEGRGARRPPGLSGPAPIGYTPTSGS